MSYFNRNKWWAIAFLLLIVMNVATLTTLWLLKDARAPHRMAPGQGVADFLVKELGLDSVQKQKLLILRAENDEKVMEMRGRTRDAKDALFSLLQKQDVPDSVIEKAAYASVYNDQQLDLLTFRHFQKIRDLCTPEQKLKFNEIVKEVIRSMGPPPPGNQTGPPPPMNGERHPDGPPPPGEDRRGPPPPRQ
jgi:Spy/CpxP family protein refolding chaperone